MCNTSSATLYEGTAQLISLTEFNHLYFSSIVLAEPLIDEEGEETVVPEANP